MLNSGNFDRKACSVLHFQPFIFTTLGNSHCVFKKSLCDEEGQVLVDNGTTTRDRRCRCDYTKGFGYVSKTTDPCYCTPFNEDCSCVFKSCGKEEVLSPGNYFT